MDKELYQLLINEKQAFDKLERDFRNKMEGKELYGIHGQMAVLLSYIRTQHVGLLKQWLSTIYEESQMNSTRRREDEN